MFDDLSENIIYYRGISPGIATDRDRASKGSLEAEKQSRTRLKTNKGKNSKIMVKILEVQDEAFRPLKHPEEPWENPGGEERTPPGPRTNRTGGGWTLTRPPDYEVPPVGGPPPSSVKQRRRGDRSPRGLEGGPPWRYSSVVNNVFR